MYTFLPGGEVKVSMSMEGKVKEHMLGLVNILANRFSDWGELSLVEGHNVCWGGGGEGRWR